VCDDTLCMKDGFWDEHLFG